MHKHSIHLSGALPVSQANPQTSGYLQLLEVQMGSGLSSKWTASVSALRAQHLACTLAVQPPIMGHQDAHRLLHWRANCSEHSNKKLWLPPPWQCSRPGWMGLGATWPGGRGPCPWKGSLLIAGRLQWDDL